MRLIDRIKEIAYNLLKDEIRDSIEDAIETYVQDKLYNFSIDDAVHEYIDHRLDTPSCDVDDILNEVAQEIIEETFE